MVSLFIGAVNSTSTFFSLRLNKEASKDLAAYKPDSFVALPNSIATSSFQIFKIFILLWFSCCRDVIPWTGISKFKAFLYWVTTLVLPKITGVQNHVQFIFLG